MNPGLVPFIIGILLAAAFLAWFWWEGRVRARAIRGLAEAQGFHYLGEVVPHSLPMASPPFASVTSVWNVVDGEPRGVRIIAFDCRFGEGRGSWRRTVIAVKTDVGKVTGLFSDPVLRIEQMKDWAFIYRPRASGFGRWQLMTVPELAAYLGAICCRTGTILVGG